MTARRLSLFLVALIAALLWLMEAAAPVRNVARDPFVKSVSRAEQPVRRIPVAYTPAAEVPIANPRRPQPALARFPFKYLGKVTENDEATIIIYGGGRTLKVRGPGPLADDYVVDEILDDALVIRHVPSGTRESLPFAAVASAPAPVGSPDDSPQD